MTIFWIIAAVLAALSVSIGLILGRESFRVGFLAALVAAVLSICSLSYVWLNELRNDHWITCTVTGVEAELVHTGECGTLVNRGSFLESQSSVNVKTGHRYLFEVAGGNKVHGAIELH